MKKQKDPEAAETVQTGGDQAVAQQRRVQLFLVVWDDNQGLCIPMMWDDDCAGAICGGAVRKTDRVAIFTDRKAARKAIDISTKWNALRKAQGHVYNEDFEGDCRKCLRVVQCLLNTEVTRGGVADVE